MNDKPNEIRNLETIKTNNLPDPLDIDLPDPWADLPCLPNPWYDLPDQLDLPEADFPEMSGLNFPDPLKSLDGLPDMASLDFPDPLSLDDLTDQLKEMSLFEEEE